MNGELRPARAHLLTFVIAVVGALLTVAVLVPPLFWNCCRFCEYCSVAKSDE